MKSSGFHASVFKEGLASSAATREAPPAIANVSKPAASPAANRLLAILLKRISFPRCEIVISGAARAARLQPIDLSVDPNLFCAPHSIVELTPVGNRVP